MIRELLELNDVISAWEHCKSVMRKLNFDRLLYGRTHFASGDYLGDEQDFRIHSSHVPEYFEEYVKSGEFRNSAFLLWSLDNIGLVSWSELPRLDFSERQVQQMMPSLEVNKKHGVTAGFTVSFSNHLPGQKSAASVCAAPGMTQVEVDSILSDVGRDLEIYWGVFDLKMHSFPFPMTERNLKPRQREELHWYARGKTVEAIGIIINLKATTVEKYFRVARETLDVATADQAVTS